MDEPQVQTVRKTYTYKLKPGPEQERSLERTLMLCRHVDNAAVGERREAWQTGGVWVSYSQQQAELPGIKEAMPEDAEVYSQVVQEVVLRGEGAFQTCFRRVQAGPGWRDPRLSALPWKRPLQPSPLSAVRQWRDTGQWLPGPLQAWAHRGALVPPSGRHAQDRRDLQRGGRVVGLLLLCGCATATRAAHRTGNGD
jgi:hypothetical protein